MKIHTNSVDFAAEGLCTRLVLVALESLDNHLQTRRTSCTATDITLFQRSVGHRVSLEPHLLDMHRIINYPFIFLGLHAIMAQRKICPLSAGSRSKGFGTCTVNSSVQQHCATRVVGAVLMCSGYLT